MDVINRLKQHFFTILILSILLLVGASFTQSAQNVHAQFDPSETSCEALDAVSGDGCESGESEIEGTITAVINILLFVVGIAAVIMLIVGGIRYVVSGGDQQAVATAKNTIIYSIVGIVVAIMAFAIVNFVLDRV